MKRRSYDLQENVASSNFMDISRCNQQTIKLIMNVVSKVSFSIALSRLHFHAVLQLQQYLHKNAYLQKLKIIENVKLNQAAYKNNRKPSSCRLQ